MAAYRNFVFKISARFKGLEFHHVFRDGNQVVNVLALTGAKHNPVPKNTFMERLFKPSVVWQDEGKDAGADGPEQTIRPAIERDKEIIGDSAL